MEECICCEQETELEYSCDVCGNWVCGDCTRFEQSEDGEEIICCEDCYNNGELGAYLENN